MALKTKITKSEHDALSDELKLHYKADGDNFLLESDEANELRRAKERSDQERETYRQQAETLKREKDEAEDRARAAALEKAKKDKDIEALENSWKADKEAAVNAEKAVTEKREKQLREILEENEALRIASEISTLPKLIAPLLRNRLRAELDGDKPFTRVLDEAGQPTAKTLEELKREFVDNKEFASIIKGTNASGGGAGGDGNSGGGADKKFSDLSEAERVEMHRTNPEKYRELAKASGVTLYNN